MALQSSGAISLNDLHIEAGGTSGTICSINDSDIRDMISKGPGAQMSFNEWYGASSSILTLNVSLTLSRGNRTTSNCDYKGNCYSTTTGYYYYLNVANWNSLSFASGQQTPRAYLGTFPSNATSVASTYDNFLGSTGGTTYNSVSWGFTTTTNTSNAVESISAMMELKDVGGSTNYAHYPAYNSNTAMPTGWTNLNVSFSYGGTNYSWDFPRSGSNLTHVDFTFGGSVSAGWTPLYLNTGNVSSSGFIGAGNSTAITITGATITIT